MKLTGKARKATLTINGVKSQVRVSIGPWVKPGVSPTVLYDHEMIKLTALGFKFPESYCEHLDIVNKTDSREDYYESDSVRLYPGHPLYEMAKEVAAR